MKKYILLFCIVIAGLSSCKKSSTDSFDAAAQATADDAAIKAYITQFNIPAIKDPSGLYYQILTPGDAAHPTLSSGVTVAYTATLLATSTVIETATSTYLNPLGDLIDGWKIGVPKIGKGGRIMLFIPSGLGYKNEDHNKVPANSVLIYDITLQGFVNN